MEVSWADGSPSLRVLEELSRILHVPLSSAEGSPVLPAVELCVSHLWYTHWEILSAHRQALHKALSP